MRPSPTACCFRNITNAEKRGKRQVLIRPSSKVVIKFLQVMMKHGPSLPLVPVSRAATERANAGLFALRRLRPLTTDWASTSVWQRSPWSAGQMNKMGRGGHRPVCSD